MWLVAAVLDSTVLGLSQPAFYYSPSPLSAPAKLQRVGRVPDLTVSPISRPWLLLFICNL